MTTQHSTGQVRYECPLCGFLQQTTEGNPLSALSDIVSETPNCMALVNEFFVPNHVGHVIVIPKQHITDIYSFPDNLGNELLTLVTTISQAMKLAYECSGITLLQNNEPAGDQHAFHFHLHVFPRYTGVEFHSQLLKRYLADPDERTQYALKLQAALER